MPPRKQLQIEEFIPTVMDRIPSGYLEHFGLGPPKFPPGPAPKKWGAIDGKDEVKEHRKKCQQWWDEYQTEEKKKLRKQKKSDRQRARRQARGPPKRVGRKKLPKPLVRITKKEKERAENGLVIVRRVIQERRAGAGGVVKRRGAKHTEMLPRAKKTLRKVWRKKLTKKGETGLWLMVEEPHGPNGTKPDFGVRRLEEGGTRKGELERTGEVKCSLKVKKLGPKGGGLLQALPASREQCAKYVRHTGKPCEAVVYTRRPDGQFDEHVRTVKR